MPALNFKEQFVQPIILGMKPGTIRQERKQPIKVGDTLYLFTGMRTKNCRKFMTAECKAVYPIVINQTASKRFVCIDGMQLGDNSLAEFVFDDGFSSVDEFFDFFIDQYGLPFRGHWIVWKTETAQKVERFLKIASY